MDLNVLKKIPVGYMTDLADLSSHRPDGVAIVVHHDDRVLGIRRRHAPTGIALPGGSLVGDESSKNAALRELFEETGLRGLPNATYSLIRRSYTIPKAKKPFDLQIFEVTTLISGDGSDVTRNLRSSHEGRAMWVSWGHLFQGPFRESAMDAYSMLRTLAHVKECYQGTRILR